MRLFIAAALPVTVQEAVQNLQNQYTLPGVRPVPAANLHLTLHFLGETPEANLPIIQDKLQGISLTHNAFNLEFEESAPGPKLKSPRLVWVRFKQNPDYEKLARTVSSAFPESSNAHPDLIAHITIARLKKEKLTGAALPVCKDINFPAYQVNTIALWQSELGSPHPRYSVLQEFALLPEAGM